jgi:hypothetical protein
MQKTGEIFLIGEKGRLVAYLRPPDGASDIFLCAADAKVCDRHPHLRELLSELGTEVALNRSREADDSVTLPVREPLRTPALLPRPPGTRPAA